MLKGVGASAGIGIGKVICIREQSLDYSQVAYQGKDKEKERLKAAAETFCEITQKMAEDIRERVGQKESEILTGQVMMLQDPFMMGQMEDAINSGSCAEAAVDSVCQMYIEMFSNVEDELMKQRATDIGDIRTRMLRLLLGIESVDVSAVPKGTVLAARDLTPSMTVGLKRENISAIVTEIGGKTSHSAILARALEIPAVLGIAGALEQLQDGQTAIVDGGKGEVLISPDTETLYQYTKLQEEQLRQKAMLSIYRDKPTVDADGRQYQLYANIGSVMEAQAALDNGAEGIGLFRTEFLFMDRPSMPDEEEQYEAYAAVSRIMQGREVIIRTLDVGGDKEVSYLKMGAEQNPFLGWRAIRYCLEETDLYKTQLRALLRAGAQYRNIKIMLPLVTGVQEVRAAKALLEMTGYHMKGKADFSGLREKVEEMGFSEAAKKLGIGEPTLRDIVKELLQPGRDPRDELPAPMLRTDVMKMEDLKPGMELKGTVRNVIDFGAFVDIGVHQDGLVHISQICNSSSIRERY